MILEKFGKPDIVFCGTDCRSYSVAAISKHRKLNKETGNLDPISDFAKFSDEMNIHVRQMIKELNPKIEIWENPRAALRKMNFMKDLKCQTVSYCQYGFTYMKPTDLFSNIDLRLKPVCKNGMKCHVSAPRGSQTGLQGIKDKAVKAMYPPLLCEHIVDVCEDYINNSNVCEECRDCLFISGDCNGSKERCKKYHSKYNLDWRLNVNDEVILYNKKFPVREDGEYVPDNLYEECKTCKNLWSSMKCDVCEDFDMYEDYRNKE